MFIINLRDSKDQEASWPRLWISLLETKKFEGFGDQDPWYQKVWRIARLTPNKYFDTETLSIVPQITVVQRLQDYHSDQYFSGRKSVSKEVYFKFTLIFKWNLSQRKMIRGKEKFAGNYNDMNFGNRISQGLLNSDRWLHPS